MNLKCKLNVEVIKWIKLGGEIFIDGVCHKAGTKLHNQWMMAFKFSCFSSQGFVEASEK